MMTSVSYFSAVGNIQKNCDKGIDLYLGTDVREFPRPPTSWGAYGMAEDWWLRHRLKTNAVQSQCCAGTA
jgi:hypothetical protein